MKKRFKSLRPIHPNKGIEMAYRRKLLRYIDEMNNSVLYWITAYNKTTSYLAEDEAPFTSLKRSIRLLAKRWIARFDELADDLSKWFGHQTMNRSDAALMKILKDGGFAVDLDMTPAVRMILNATIAQNVSLIRSIPRESLGQVEAMVMRAVETGREQSELVNELEQNFAITRKRAMLIARHQNNIATASITKARQLEVGITKARWLHSYGGRHPRATHIKASRDRVIYDIAEGWFDPHEQKYIWPGELINCRCVAVPIIEGMKP